MVNVGRVVRSKRLGCQRITVKRYAASWHDGAYGRDADNPIVLQVAAIVTVAQPKDLQLFPEGDRVTGAMKFLSRSACPWSAGFGRAPPLSNLMLPR